MKTIVVLDAHTLSPLQPGEHSPAHPCWDKLASLGSLTLYPRTKPEDVVARAADAEILLTNKAIVSAEHIAALPKLQYIGVMATGYNVVNLGAANDRGIPVTNVPGYSTMSVAQNTFALLLELAERVGAHDAAVKNGDWVRCPDFYFAVSPIIELAGKTLGIIGLGTIGQAVARIGVAFGMRVIAYSRSQREMDFPMEWVSLDELFAQSDVLSLHCPLTPETDHIIKRENLVKMKSSAFLLNTSRGPLVNEADVAEALRNKTIAGFGTDVLSSEPPKSDNPLLSAPNAIITPHIAWASVEARTRLMDTLAENIAAFLGGHPTNVVNGLTGGAAPAPSPQAAPVEPAPVETSLPGSDASQSDLPEGPLVGQVHLIIRRPSNKSRRAKASTERQRRIRVNLKAPNFEGHTRRFRSPLNRKASQG